MHAIGVVVADKAVDRLVGLSAVLIVLKPNLFDFERFEKALHERVAFGRRLVRAADSPCAPNHFDVVARTGYHRSQPRVIAGTRPLSFDGPGGAISWTPSNALDLGILAPCSRK